MAELIHLLPLPDQAELNPHPAGAQNSHEEIGRLPLLFGRFGGK
jgi:hypothetical protein